MNGLMQLPLRGRKYFEVYGGPYIEKPTDVHGVKMAVELALRLDGMHEINIPTRDFHVPDRDLLSRGLEQAVDLILKGEPVYVGCMGGKGRTGLFLAVLAKAFGIESPVEYVRRHYYAHAVETQDQYDYVLMFEVPAAIDDKIRHARGWRSLLRFRRAQTREPVSARAFKQRKSVAREGKIA